MQHQVIRRAAMYSVVYILLWAHDFAAQTPAPASPSAHSTREVVDEAGRTVRVPLVPLRIVSLAPSLTETVYALGLQERLVGDTDFCDYPPEAQKKIKVGGGINPNLEVIASLHPDLVLVTNSFNRLDTVRALDALGIPSYSTDPHTVDEIISSTQKLADILGAPDAGKSMSENLQRRLASLQSRISSLPYTRVLFVVWTEPLMSVGKSTFVADALRKAGALSIVDSAQNWPQMNLEEVVRLQPDYLVFAEAHSNGGAHDFDTVAIKPGWQLLEAVQNRKFAVVSDAVIRPAPRIVSVIEDLARQLHPGAFQESPGTEKEAVPQNRVNPSHTTLHLSEPPLFADTCSTVVSCAR
jgi:iron complex transport system substrate-binding protein